MSERECPKCGEPMEHVDYDPDVGVMQGYWFCTEEGCDGTLPEEDWSEEDFAGL